MGAERHLINLNNERRGNGEQEQDERPLNPREQALNAGHRQNGRGGAATMNGNNRPQLVAQGLEPGPLSGEDQQAVRTRAGQRGVRLEEKGIKNGATAHVNLDVNKSMAADPGFEDRAMNWEMRFGGMANNDGRAQAMADKAGRYVLNYVEAKVRKFGGLADTHLSALGTDKKKFSGAVGDAADKVRTALQSGSVASKMIHFQNFADKFLKGELDRDGGGGQVRETILEATRKGPTPEMEETITRFNTSANRAGERMQSPRGIPGEQWHTRAERRDPRDRGTAEGRAYNDRKDQSHRTYGEFKAETGTDYSRAEKEHMEIQHDDERLPIEEGGEKWVINEMDNWVKQMRDLSLPLLAGPSGTTARLMQAFQKLELNDQPAHSRLACIAYILPNRHHSLVEIMTGAAQNGGPAFQPSPDFYHNILPFSEGELRAQLGNFPDEPNG